MEFVVAGLAVLLMLVAFGYNQLIRAKVHIRQAWAQVAVQLQRRHDLIPRLVEVVAAYSTHEADLLAEVTAARTKALAETDPQRRPLAEDQVEQSLNRLIVRVENYPELQANELYTQLANQLRETEDRLAFARGFANDRVARYRKLTQTFPGTVLAKMFGFPSMEMFALDDPRAAAVPGIELGRQ